MFYLESQIFWKTNAQANNSFYNFYPLTYVAIERVLVPNTHFCLLLKNGKRC